MVDYIHFVAFIFSARIFKQYSSISYNEIICGIKTDKMTKLQGQWYLT